MYHNSTHSEHATVNLSVLAVCLLVLLGVAGGCAGQQGDPVAVPTHQEQDGEGFSETAEISGRLTGETVEGGACFWLEREDGERLLRVLVVWPAGYRAKLQPLQLLNAEGEVVASEGQFIYAGGGYISPGVAGHCRSNDEIGRVDQIVSVTE
jgi:hypothetical protein